MSITKYKINTERDLQEVIASSNSINSLALFSDLAIEKNSKNVIHFSTYHKIVRVKRKEKEITVQAGITFKKFINLVQACGWTIPCIPEIDELTIAEALSVGRHGTSGFILSKYVSNFRIILANGTVKEFTEKDIEINGIRLSLGLLGVLSEVTFTCENNYKLHVKEDLQKDALWLSQLDTLIRTYDYLKIYWLPHTNYGRCIKGIKVDDGFRLKRGRSPQVIKQCIDDFLYKKVLKKIQFSKRANLILKRLYFSSKTAYIASLHGVSEPKDAMLKNNYIEWSIPYSQFQNFFSALKTVLEDKTNAVFIYGTIEFNFLKKDNIWLSHACFNNVVTLKITYKDVLTKQMKFSFSEIKKIVLEHKGSFYWTDVLTGAYTQQSDLKLKEFKKLRKTLDPTNKFMIKNLKGILEK